MKISDMSNDELAKELEDAAKLYEDDVEEGEREEHAILVEAAKRLRKPQDEEKPAVEVPKAEKGECHVINNPCWLADRFVFKELHTNSIFGMVDTTVFITLNNRDKIEDADCDISYRMHNIPMSKILKKSRTATETEAALLNSIDDEFWLMRYSHIKLREERKW